MLPRDIGRNWAQQDSGSIPWVARCDSSAAVAELDLLEPDVPEGRHAPEEQQHVGLGTAAA